MVRAHVLPVQYDQRRDVFAFIAQLPIEIIFDDRDSVLELSGPRSGRKVWEALDREISKPGESRG